MSFQRLVEAELARARSRRQEIRSVHDGYAVIKQELDELWEEVRKKEADPARLLEELIQTAAMCQRTAEDLQLVDERVDW